jgi:hypothetical protein
VKYTLDTEFKERLEKNIKLLLSLPFMGYIDGDVWERAVAHSKKLSHTTTKKLFDVVDPKNKDGWSVKTVFGDTSRLNPTSVIIARANIVSKFSKNLDENPQNLGNCLIDFWNNKVINDANTQNIKNKYISILVKSKNMETLAYFEKKIDFYDKKKFEWRWSNGEHKTLRGYPKGADYWKFSWNPRGYHFNEKWLIPEESLIFNYETKNISPEALYELL